MTQRIGIPTAVDANGGVFDRSDVGRTPEPFARPLRCGGCSIPVTTQSPHTKQRGNIHVAGSYKRMPNGPDHDQGCRYAFDARVGQLVQEHRAEVEREHGRYVLLLRELMRHPHATEPPESVADPRSRLQVSTRPGQPKATATLQAAAQIARLLSDFDDDDEVADNFVATYQGRTVTWRQFFYRADREALRLTAYLDTKPAHPIAVMGAIHTLRPSLKGDTWSAEIRLGRTLLTTARERVHVTLRANDRGSLAGRPGQMVLAYGLWGLWRPTKSKTPSVFARLWCDRAGAAAVVD